MAAEVVRDGERRRLAARERLYAFREDPLLVGGERELARGAAAQSDGLFERHPAAFVLDATAPSADFHKCLEVLHPFKNPARRTGDDQPHTEDEEHLKDGFPKIGNVRLVS